MITYFACGSDAVCGDAVGLEARYLLDMIALDERRRADRDGEPLAVLEAERTGRGCHLCGDESAVTMDGECAPCRGLSGVVRSVDGGVEPELVYQVDFEGYADRYPL